MLFQPRRDDCTLAVFQPARTGTYYLRARLRHIPDNKVSGFCPYSTVKVS